MIWIVTTVYVDSDTLYTRCNRLSWSIHFSCHEHQFRSTTLQKFIYLHTFCTTTSAIILMVQTGTQYPFRTQLPPLALMTSYSSISNYQLFQFLKCIYFRVFQIPVITILRLCKNVITIHLIGNLPLQFLTSLNRAILYIFYAL